jgi:hypothetical protein
VSAQNIDRSFVFVDENGAEIENGATVVRNQMEYDEDLEVEVIYSGLSVKKTDNASSNYLRMHYKITRLDNGIYQLCFPMNCEKQTVAGDYITNSGSLMFNPHPLQSEWFPNEDGSCIVELTIEVMKQVTAFPPEYAHLADGPSLTLKFEKGASLPGDVNGDGAVNIGDINAIINFILTPKADFSVADVNGDGAVNISDINAVIAMIMGN